MTRRNPYRDLPTRRTHSYDKMKPENRMIAGLLALAVFRDVRPARKLKGSESGQDRIEATLEATLDYAHVGMSDEDFHDLIVEADRVLARID